MSERNFMELLRARWAEGKSVCVGMDPEWEKMPGILMLGLRPKREVLVEFCCKIVDETKDLVCAFKPNLAFFLHIDQGLEALHQIIKHINLVAPGVPVIFDAKQADIGNTNKGYVKTAFDVLGADAITVHPYLGREALQPFLDQKNKGVIVLCKTSNEGSDEFQGKTVNWDSNEMMNHFVRKSISPYSLQDGTTLSNYIAWRVSRHWNTNGNCLLVAGATYPAELQSIRKIVGDDMPLLIPGIGAQGGDLEATVNAGKNSKGQGMIINSSRGIIFASGEEDFADAARRETLKLHEAIQQTLEKGKA